MQASKNFLQKVEYAIKKPVWHRCCTYIIAINFGVIFVTGIRFDFQTVMPFFLNTGQDR